MQRGTLPAEGHIHKVRSLPSQHQGKLLCVGKGKEQLGGWGSNRRTACGHLLPGFCDVSSATFLRKGYECVHLYVITK